MIKELEQQLERKLFCGICHEYVDKVIEVYEVDKNGYLKRLWCIKCFTKAGEKK